MSGSSPEASAVPFGGASRQSARTVLLVTLLLAAGAALFVQPRVIEAVRTGGLDASWLVATPGIFSVVVVLAAVDTWRTARRRGYFRGPSVVLLAGCVAFMGLLLPNTFTEYRARTSPPVESAAWHQALLKNRDPRVRALVMEVAGLNPELTNAPDLLAQGLDDPDPLVVEAAVAAVQVRSGVPLDAATARDRARELVRSWTPAQRSGAEPR